MSQFSQIACEVCRAKKRKCDRKIPTCSQCVHASQTCTYPGTNKRGLPSGYLANIEERLAQTETALLRALSIIHGSEIGQLQSQQDLEVPTARSERPRELEFNEVRIARVEEWQRFPLNTAEQQRHWMSQRLALPEMSTKSDSIECQQETVNLQPHKRQPKSEIESASKRRRPTSVSRGTPNPGEDHGLNPTTPTARAATTPLPLTREDIWTANNTHPATLSPYLGPAVSNPQHQHANIQYPALHFPPNTPQARTSEPADPRPEIQPEQSKAKRLASLHSRRYF